MIHWFSNYWSVPQIRKDRMNSKILNSFCWLVKIIFFGEITKKIWVILSYVLNPPRIELIIVWKWMLTPMWLVMWLACTPYCVKAQHPYLIWRVQKFKTSEKVYFGWFSIFSFEIGFRDFWSKLLTLYAKRLFILRILAKMGHFRYWNCDFQWKIVENFLEVLFFGRLKWELILIMQYQSWHKLSVKWVSLSHLPFFSISHFSRIDLIFL